MMVKVILVFILWMGGMSGYLVAEDNKRATDDADVTRVGVDKVRIIVKLMNDFLHEAEISLGDPSLKSCPFFYETNSAFYHYETEDLAKRHKEFLLLKEKACKDLKEAVSQRYPKKDSDQEKEEQSERVGQYVSQLRTLLKHDEKLQKRIADLKNPLLEERTRPSIEAHWQYLKNNGRAKMFEFFANHYGHPDDVLADLKATEKAELENENQAVLEVEKIASLNKEQKENLKKIEKEKLYKERMAVIYDNKMTQLFSKYRRLMKEETLKKEDLENKFIELAKKTKKGTRITLLKQYQKLFEGLDDEGLNNFIEDFVAAQYTLFLDQLENEAWKSDPEFYTQVQKVLYPQDKLKRAESVLAKAKEMGARLVVELTPMARELGERWVDEGERQRKIQEQEKKIDETQKKIKNIRIMLLPESEKDGARRAMRRGFYEVASRSDIRFYPFPKEGGSMVMHTPNLDQEYWSLYWHMLRGVGLSIGPPGDKLRDCFKRDPYRIRDQDIAEVVADWFAIEGLTRALEEVRLPPLSQPLSQEEKIKAIYDVIGINKLDSEPDRVGFPSSDIRINLIIRSHPTVNRWLGCEKSPRYCE